MTDMQQTRKRTPEEDIRELYSRTAKLNDQMSALLAPAWGSENGIIPTDHPLYVGENPSTAEEQAVPVDWQAIAKQRERELKTEGERKYAVEQERDDLRRRAEQYEDLLRIAHDTSNRSEAERARFARIADDRADTIAELIADRARLRTRLAEQEAETMRQHERADQAEAALERVRALADRWDRDAPPPGNRPLTELRTALNQPASTANPKENPR